MVPAERNSEARFAAGGKYQIVICTIGLSHPTLRPSILVLRAGHDFRHRFPDQVLEDGRPISWASLRSTVRRYWEKLSARRYKAFINWYSHE